MPIPFEEIDRIVDKAISIARRKRKLHNLKDIKQEIWVQILEAMDKHKNTNAGYIYTIAFRTAAGQRQKMCVYDRFTKEEDVDVEWLSGKVTDEKNREIWEEAISRINALIAAAECFDVLRKVILEKKTAKRIAKEKKVPVRKIFAEMDREKKMLSRDKRLKQLYRHYKELSTT